MYVNFSTRGVLCLIRHPKDIRRAYPFTVIPRLPVAVLRAARQVPAYSGSGFPRTCLNSRIPCYVTSHRQESMGLPKFPEYLFLHAMACGLRRIYSSSPITDEIVLPSEPVTSSASATSLFRSCTSTSGSADSPTACKILCLRFTCIVRRILHDSATGARLDTERMANPSPAGTFTLQDTPSLAWRETGMMLTSQFLLLAGLTFWLGIWWYRR